MDIDCQGATVSEGSTIPTESFERLAPRDPRHAELLHLLGEVELVFGFGAVVLVAVMASIQGSAKPSNTPSRGSPPLFVYRRRRNRASGRTSHAR